MRVSNLSFKNYRKESNVLKSSYKPNWSKEIYQIVFISKPSNFLQQPLYVIKDENDVKMRFYRNSLQLLSLANSRSTSDSRVLNPNFYYMEYYRQNALSTREDIDTIYELPSRMKREPRRIYQNISFRDFILYK